jgi:hypothetical protein
MSQLSVLTLPRRKELQQDQEEFLSAAEVEAMMEDLVHDKTPLMAKSAMEQHCREPRIIR